MHLRNPALAILWIAGSNAALWPYKPSIKRSTHQMFELDQRQDSGYQPTQTLCTGNGTTCDTACGPTYVQCPSNDDGTHCYDPAQQETCCPDGSGNSCQASYYCALDGEEVTYCCPSDMTPSQCAAAYGLEGGLNAESTSTTSTTSSTTSTTSSMMSTTSTTTSTTPATTSMTSTPATSAGTTPSSSPATIPTTQLTTTPLPSTPPPSTPAPASSTPASSPAASSGPPASSPPVPPPPPASSPAATPTTSSLPSTSAPSLNDALVQAGCSNFLAFIQSDPTLFALYSSGKVKTVFAPSDAYFNSSSAARLRRDLTPGQLQAALLSAGQVTAPVSTLGQGRGAVVPTFDNTANLMGVNQVVVSQPKTGPNLEIASGLGNQVTVVNGNQPYTNGIIQVTNGLFTVPQILSNTANAAGLTTFNSLVSRAGMTNSLDNQATSTFFVPSNDAATAAGLSSSSDSAAKQIVGGLVVPNMAGYLPNLQNGQVLNTMNGGSVQVTVDSTGATFVNGVPILQSNLILPNGVAHVMGGVVTGAESSSPGSSSSASPAAASGTAAPVPSGSASVAVVPPGTGTATTPGGTQTFTPSAVATAVAGTLKVAWSLVGGSAALAILNLI